ncbi:MAG: sulfite exporter TauE/SafE family protein [Betaproteobacteria bacterium]|nr:sulfite exporter TauE/SafE family protein [Betaproteobacteria bacterium]MCH9848750.1 sulfite exporter TauE/SafE family protein [Betaproteobacteria bacterium]
MSSIEIISALLGTLIGFILALTGAGGGMLAIPLLVFFLPISIFEAAPIALFAVFIGSSIGAVQGLWEGVVRYKTALLIALTGIVLAPFGVKLAQNSSNQILGITLMGILLFIGIRSWQTKRSNADNSQAPTPACMLNPATSKLFWTASCTKRLISTGALTGFLSGLLGVGGGFIIAPNLRKVTNFNHQSVIATTLTAVSLIAIGSIASHIHSNTINWNIAIPFAASLTLSMLATSKLISHKISSTLSQKVFAILCFIAALRLAMNSLA